MTQEQVATRSGMNRSYISEVERGKENISLERAERLARAVESTLVQLLK
jgi:transcriptional regulator with XRE-family HTH domain